MPTNIRYITSKPNYVPVCLSYEISTKLLFMSLIAFSIFLLLGCEATPTQIQQKQVILAQITQLKGAKDTIENTNKLLIDRYQEIIDECRTKIKLEHDAQSKKVWIRVTEFNRKEKRIPVIGEISDGETSEMNLSIELNTSANNMLTYFDGITSALSRYIDDNYDKILEKAGIDKNKIYFDVKEESKDSNDKETTGITASKVESLIQSMGEHIKIVDKMKTRKNESTEPAATSSSSKDIDIVILDLIKNDEENFYKKYLPSNMLSTKKYLFIINIEESLKNDLNQGTIPDSLKSKFQECKISLSEKPSLKVIEEDSKWEINDQAGEFTIRKESSRLYVSPTFNGFKIPKKQLIGDSEKGWFVRYKDYLLKANYLFDIEESLKNDLNQEKIPDSLKSKFQECKISLSEKPSLKVIEEDSKWEINDQAGEFTIRKENPRLYIYKSVDFFNHEGITAISWEFLNHIIPCMIFAQISIKKQTAVALMYFDELIKDEETIAMGIAPENHFNTENLIELINAWDEFQGLLKDKKKQEKKEGE